MRTTHVASHVEALAILVAVAAAAALACGPAQQPASAPTGSGPGGPKSGGSLRLDVGLDPFNWDITIQKTSPNDDGIGLGHDNLLSFKMGP